MMIMVIIMTMMVTRLAEYVGSRIPGAFYVKDEMLLAGMHLSRFKKEGLKDIGYCCTNNLC